MVLVSVLATNVFLFRTGREFNFILDSSFPSSGGADEATNKPRNVAFLETNITMEIAQLLLSLLHAWGMEPELDRVCEIKLGLLRPMVPVSFGVISKGGGCRSVLPNLFSFILKRILENSLLILLFNWNLQIL